MVLVQVNGFIRYSIGLEICFDAMRVLTRDVLRFLLLGGALGRRLGTTWAPPEHLGQVKRTNDNT